MEFYFQHEKGFVKCNINEIRWEKYIQNFQNSFFDILTSHRIIKGVTIINILKIRSHYLLETFPIHWVHLQINNTVSIIIIIYILY